MMTGKFYLLSWVLLAVVNTFMALSEIKINRMLMLIVILVLQHITLLSFMVDYDSLGSQQWKEREQKIREETRKEIEKEIKKKAEEEMKEKLRVEVRDEMKEGLVKKVEEETI